MWIENLRKGHLIYEIGNDKIPLHSYVARMRAFHFGPQAITYIFPTGYYGLSLQVEGIKNPVRSKHQKPLKAHELGPGAQVKTGHFKAPSLPCAQTWAQASGTGQEPQVYKPPRKHQGERLVFTKTKHYLQRPARLTRSLKLQWIQQPANTETS